MGTEQEQALMPLAAEILTWVMGGLILLDLVLVFTGIRSISMQTWIACQLHPTLIAAGMLGCVALMYFVREAGWGYTGFVGIMAGHLFSGIPVDSALPAFACSIIWHVRLVLWPVKSLVYSITRPMD